MLIKLFARDNEHLMELLNDKIQMIPGVVGTETLISLDHSISRVLGNLRRLSRRSSGHPHDKAPESSVPLFFP